MEIDILNFIQSLRTDSLDSVMLFFSTLGDKGIFWLSIGFFMLIFKKSRFYGLMLLLSVTAGFLIGEVTLKNIICRARPSQDFFDMIGDRLLINPKSFAFPSGHTTSSFAAAFSLFKYKKNVGVCAYIVASLIAFSRMYLYVHYPTDILGGILLGTVCAFLVYHIATKRIENKGDLACKD